MEDRNIIVLDRMFLVITGQCNATCKLCHYWRKKDPQHLDLDFIQKKILPLIRQYHIRIVLITGGEPTLHPHLPDILRLLKTTYVDIGLITNGTQLPTHFEQILPYVDSFMFSLDAADQTRYNAIRGLDNFHQLLQWPGKIRQQYPWTQIAFLCLLQKQNISQLLDIYKLAATLPVDALIFNVPELKPQCFGRNARTPAPSKAHAQLTPDQLDLLRKNLEEIRRIDREGLVFQSPRFFNRVVDYFRYLHPDTTTTGPLNPPEKICRVPLDSMVIHETKHVSPCFYLPFSVPFHRLQAHDPFNDPALLAFRQDFATGPKLRSTHCAHCLQFQS